MQYVETEKKNEADPEVIEILKKGIHKARLDVKALWKNLKDLDMSLINVSVAFAYVQRR